MTSNNGLQAQAELDPGYYEERPGFFTDASLVDANPPVKVLIVGAGLSGVITAILLSHKVRNLSITIYDKNPAIGGTWLENVYPGVRCDVPSHCYQTTFAPNLEWSEYYSQGSEIQDYYEKLAHQYNIIDHVKFCTEVVKATWDSEASQWEVRTKHLATSEVAIEKAEFFINAQGRLNKPQLPSIPGLQDRFQGKIVHTAAWDPDCELDGKRVAIIGNGASGQQILPNILPRVAHVDHYIRSKVWVTPAFQKSLVPATAEHPGGHSYTEEEMRRFKSDPAYYLAYRRNMESLLHNRFPKTILGSKENEAIREACIATMSDRLKGDQEWLERLKPDFAPGCKRLTPAPGYLEALQNPKVTFFDTKIAHVTEKGVVTEDGTENQADVIIAATGFVNSFAPHFPTIGLNRVDISKLWAPNGSVGYPETYFGVMAPEMPNYFFTLQAQGNGAGGSIPLQCEISATYIAKVIRKVQNQSYKSITPSRRAVEEFNDLCVGHFHDKVVSDNCSSWLKLNGPKPRNIVWWPGSSHHRAEIYRDPRWEDFDYERKDNAGTNRYAYFGSGYTQREKCGGNEHLTSYLKEVGKIDLALVHENWNE